MTPVSLKRIVKVLTGRRKKSDRKLRTEGETQHNIQEPRRPFSRLRALSTSPAPRPIIFEVDRNQKSVISSPLLALPAEIRLQIFEYVVGRHFLHIFLGRKLIAYIKCPFDSISSIQDDSSVGFQNCSECNYDGTDAEEGHHFATLIKTCRQVYQECIDLLYTTNVFDVRGPSALHYFQAKVLPAHFATIRILQLSWEAAYFPTDQDHAAMDSWLDEDLFEKLGAPERLGIGNRFHVWLWACKIIATKMPGLRVLRIRLLFRHRLHMLLRGHIERTLRPLKRCIGLDAFDVMVVSGSRDRHGELNGLRKLVDEMREVVCRRVVS